MARGLVHSELPAGGSDRSGGFRSSLLGRSFTDPRLPGPGCRSARGGEHRGGRRRGEDGAGIAGRAGIIVSREREDIPTSPVRVQTYRGGPDGRAPIPQAGGLARCAGAGCNGFRVFRSDGSAGRMRRRAQLDAPR